MVCEKCGAELSDDARFCSNCGTTITESPAIEEAENASAATATNPGKKNYALIGGIIGAVIIVLIAFLIFRKPTVDVSDYFEIVTTGYESYGTASLEFDSAGFVKDNGKKLKLNKNNPIAKDYMALFDQDGNNGANLFLLYLMYPQLDKSDHLSNGDRVAASWSNETAELQEMFTCKLKFPSFSVKVADLEDVKELYPFDYVNILVDGKAPFATLKIDKPGPEDFLSYIDFSADKSAGISNGDVITVTASLLSYVTPQEFAERCGLELGECKYQFTVSGLEEAVTFDPFDYADISVWGVSPYGHLEVNTNTVANPVMEYLKTNIEPADGLANGDTVEISMEFNSYYSQDEVLEKYGKLPENKTITYTVEGLPEYLQSASQIDDDTLAAMKAQAEDMFTAHVASTWGEAITLTDLSFLGTYFLKVKPGYDDSWYERNAKDKLYLVYEVTSMINVVDKRTGEDVSKEVRFYYSYGLDDISIDQSGKIDTSLANIYDVDHVFKVNVDAHWDKFGVGCYEFYFDGYETLDALYNDVVASNKDKYHTEVNIIDSTVEAAEATA